MVIFPLAAVLSLPVVSAQEPAAPSAEVAAMMSTVQETLGALENMVIALEGIKDKATADAVAQKLPELAAALRRAEEKMEADDAVSLEMQAALMPQVMPKLMELMPRIEKALNNITFSKAIGSCEVDRIIKLSGLPYEWNGYEVSVKLDGFSELGTNIYEVDHE